jgi:hypothetical protein
LRPAANFEEEGAEASPYVGNLEVLETVSKLIESEITRLT